MSDPTDPTAEGAEPVQPDEPSPTEPSGPIGDETARVPVEPEVGWDAQTPTPTPPSMPWEAPAAAAVPSSTAPPSPATDDPSATQAGVLSAATVGWVAPPPVPLSTGQAGWVIAGVGSRLAAWILDGFIGLLLYIVLAFAFGFVAALLGADPNTLPNWLYGISIVAFFFVYFVGFWTGGGKATPGMRVLKQQVATAADGKRLSIEAATVRWLALYAVVLIGVIPALAGFSSLATVVWWIVLLITTAQQAMHQGLHDRWAKSVVVRPEAAGAGGGGVLAACLIILLIVAVFALISLVGLFLLGNQLSEILSEIGESI